MCKFELGQGINNKSSIFDQCLPLSAEDPIRIRRDGRWQPATVIDRADTPRSYHVETPDGAIYRRNRRHLQKTNETNESRK